MAWMMGSVESAAHGSAHPAMAGILLVETEGLPVCPSSAWRECAAISVAKMGAAKLQGAQGPEAAAVGLSSIL
jgi:hypothetical protein